MIEREAKSIVFISFEFNMSVCDNMKDLKIKICWTHFESLLNFHTHFKHKIN